MRLILIVALALLTVPSGATAGEYTTGTIWTPETVAAWTSNGGHLSYRVFGPGETQILGMPISGYVKQLELQVYGSEPATLTFPRLNYSVEFTPSPEPYWEQAVTTIELPSWVPFIGGTDNAVVESAGQLTFIGLNAPANRPGMFDERPWAWQSHLENQSFIGLRYLVELVVADSNGDGRVDFFDFGSLKTDFGTDNPRSDFDESGRVDIGDFGILKDGFGADIRQQGAAAVPEPDTATLVFCAAIVLAYVQVLRRQPPEEDGPWL